jgi:hypothetical protein
MNNSNRLRNEAEEQWPQKEAFSRARKIKCWAEQKQWENRA